jgi:hypothetical protein
VIRRCAAFANALYVRSYKAGKLGGLKQNLLCLLFSLLAFLPPSLQPIVALADGLMLVSQHPCRQSMAHAEQERPTIF